MVEAATWLNVGAAALTAVGFGLCVVGFRAWFRYGDPRSGFLFFAFLGFFLQGALVTWGLFVRDRVDDLVVAIVALSGASLLLVYLATLVRSPR